MSPLAIVNWRRSSLIGCGLIVLGQWHRDIHNTRVMSASRSKLRENNACVMPISLLSSFRLWDFLSARGENVILRWVADDRLSKRARAALNQKLDRLTQVDFELAIGTKLLAGPVYKHVYKMVIHADVMLRPLLCRGPINNESEYTLLRGAVEIGGKLPSGCREEAEANRGIVLQSPSRRCFHERIP